MSWKHRYPYDVHKMKEKFNLEDLFNNSANAQAGRQNEEGRIFDYLSSLHHAS